MTCQVAAPNLTVTIHWSLIVYEEIFEIFRDLVRILSYIVVENFRDRASADRARMMADWARMKKPLLTGQKSPHLDFNLFSTGPT